MILREASVCAGCISTRKAPVNQKMFVPNSNTEVVMHHCIPQWRI